MINKDDLKKYNNINIPVYNLIGKQKKVLDIGCRNGDLGYIMIKEKQCTVDGVDYLPQVLMNAKKQGYRECFQKNFNHKYLRDINEKYDYIVCADILEHILFPEKLLKELRNNLHKGGKIIISIPNIGFILYRIKHLFGFRDYEETGIMDKTHLKFYTLKTLKNLINISGYTIKHIEGYAGKNPKLFWLHRLAKIWPTMFAIQFICIIVPNES